MVTGITVLVEDLTSPNPTIQKIWKTLKRPDYEGEVSYPAELAEEDLKGLLRAVENRMWP